ncbi:MAG TPA: hypothetical protein VJR89_36530 [Polyangiales bacterium]|nr:hypothetical protein [Polyangiales bacterium]
MTTLHRFWLRSYPWLVSFWLCVANRAVALDTAAPVKPAPQPTAAEAPPPAPKPQRFRARVKFATKDGISLGADAVPPGTSLLRVEAPVDARAVTAYFSFGTILQLTRDAEPGHWRTRFEIPRELPDGAHGLTVRIVDGSGRVHWKDAEYVVDGSAPDLGVDVDEYARAGEELHVAVRPRELLHKVYVTLPDMRTVRVPLKRDDKTGLYEGKIRIPLELPRDQLRLRVVASDRARNETQVDVLVPVSLDGC